MPTPQSNCSAISITVCRATCNEHEVRSSPRHLQRARSAKFPAPLATSTECEVPRANGRTVAAGSVADFLCALYFLGNTISYIVVIVNSCFIRNS